jgi:type IV secretory pathway protease TraF
MKFNNRWGPSVISLMAGLLIPTAAFPQAAVEYGAAASKSTALGAQAGSSMRSSTRTNPRQPITRGKFVIPPLPIKNLEIIMEENRQKLADQSKAGGGTLHVESNPAKASVIVDGKPVGVSPLDLKLPQGKHLVELTHPRYDVWSMEVTVSPNESTSVTAQLETRYKSTITLSIQ